MEIVIDIPEKEYKKLVNPYQYNEYLCSELKKIVREGTPLPEHHGRLIDADDLLDANIDTFSQQTELKIKLAQTIIEGSESE